MFDEENHEPAVLSDINTTPLIDVMLVLLIMLIITVPLQTHSVTIDTPTGPPPTALAVPDVIRIDIDPAGRIAWNGEEVGGRDILRGRLSAAARAEPTPELHIRCHKQAAYDHLARFMALAQSQGVTKLGVVGAEQFLE